MSVHLYLITGAAGGTGGVSRQVIEQLLKRGHRVRALVHHDDARAVRCANSALRSYSET